MTFGLLYRPHHLFSKPPTSIAIPLVFPAMKLGGRTTTSLILSTASLLRNSAFPFTPRNIQLPSRLFASSSMPPLKVIHSPDIPLRDGMLHPQIGYGTYKVGFIPASASGASASAGPDRSAKECVMDALSVGYRFFECAEFYGNEKEIGEAFKESKVDRKDLFLCSKVWTTTIEKGRSAVRKQLMQTLEDLNTDYIDLYLIHWPVPVHHVQAYKELVELQKEGFCRGIGVSNYAFEDYEELKAAGIESLPLVNQIEINPLLYRKNTIRKFTEEGVVLQSYRALKDGKAFENPIIKSIASSHKRSPAQILGRWCVQHGFIYVPKSSKKERMIENAEVFDFELSATEMDQLDNMTTQESLEAFEILYRKCVNRDTTKDGSLEGVKMEITRD